MVVHDGDHTINLQGQSLIVGGSASATIRGHGRILVCTAGSVDVHGSFVVTVLKGRGIFKGCAVYVYGDLTLEGDAEFVVIPKGQRRRQ